MHLYWRFDLSGFVNPRRRPPDELADLPLLREHRITGRFWLPTAPEATWWGELHFRPGDVAVVTVDDPPWQVSPRDGIDVPVLHARLSDGTPCTLFRGTALAETYFREDRPYHRATIFVRDVLAGAHLAAVSDPSITSLECQFTRVNEWIGSPYSITHERGENRAVVSFRARELHLPLEWEGTRFELALTCRNTHPIAAGSKPLKWSYDYRFRIAADVPQPLDWFLAVAVTLRRCLIFLVGCAVYTSDLVPSFASENQRPITGYLLHCTDVPTIVRADPKQFATSFPEVAESLLRAVPAWFQKSAQLNVVTHAYAGTLLNNGAYEESVFLGVVQALEHFHGLLFPERNRYFSRLTWKAFLGQLRQSIAQALKDVSAVPDGEIPNYARLIGERMGSINQTSLQTKMEDLLQEIPGMYCMPLLDNPRELTEAVGFCETCREHAPCPYPR